jgi:glutathione S-transferase
MKDIRLVIGNKNYSSWSMCPWLLLKMYGIDFDEIQIRLFQDNTAEKIGPYSPSLKVPVLLYKGTTIWDSLSICEFISENLLNGFGWPTNLKSKANARSISAEVHSEFTILKKEWPMNCKASYRLNPSDELQNEIARINTIWGYYRQRFAGNGNYLYGRFSIADCMFAPIAVSFQSYGAELCEEANTYMENLLKNPFVNEWKISGRREKENLSIAYAKSA